MSRVDNLWTNTDYQGLDPALAPGTKRVRQATFGINSWVSTAGRIVEQGVQH